MTNNAPTTCSPSSVNGNIRVVVRVRPKVPLEKNHTCELLAVDKAKKTIELHTNSSASSTSTTTTTCVMQQQKRFVFDQVFDATSSQKELFGALELSQTVSSVLEGFHATIFAYGQTGSGKTFTMEGYEYERHASVLLGERATTKPRLDVSSDRLGIIPRTILELFEQKTRLETEQQREFVIKCSFLQIYNEQILDLLNASSVAMTSAKAKSLKGLRLRWNSLQEFYVENLTLLECSSPQKLLELFHQGLKHKVMASHNLNAASSRSHCVLTVFVESFSTSDSTGSGPGAGAGAGAGGEVFKSKLALVDLAGSERVDKTGASGLTLQESIGINKSLFVLRQVIQALSESRDGSESTAPPPYIPYRDSKLTCLLKYALGGNSLTLMIACLSPSDHSLDENLSTLFYAAKAQSIANKPMRNQDPKTLQIQQLKEEVASLQRQLAQAQQVVLALQQPPTTTLCSQCSASLANNQAIDTGARPEPAAARAQAPKPETNTSTQPDTHKSLQKLQANVIDNVSMIKQLYQTEKKLRDQIACQMQTVDSLRHETRVLNVENQSLREKMEMLEYLLFSKETEASSQEITDHEDAHEPQDVLEIPEYGTISTSLSANLPTIPVPATERIRKLLMAKKTRITPDNDPPNHQSPPATMGISTGGSSNTKETKSTAHKPCETGLLSLSDLKDLLGKKKPGGSNSSSSQNKYLGSRRTTTSNNNNNSHADDLSTGARRPDSLSSRISMPEAINSLYGSTSPPTSRSTASTGTNRSTSNRHLATTSSILQQIEAPGTAFEQDPLDALSELNRLLRVKAALRRGSS